MDNAMIPDILICFLTLVTIGIVLRGLQLALRKTGWQEARQNKILGNSSLVVFIWLTALALLSYRGFFNHFDLPPRPVLAILLPLPVILWIAFSKKGTELLKQVPPQWLVFIQSFRILVEVLIWIAYLNSLLPVQMSFEGRNYDILTGILALPVGYFCFVKKSWHRSVAILWNFIGIVLLLNILIVAVLSMPGPLRHFMNEPPNTIVAKFPFIYLPGALVVIAYSMHIFSLRQLMVGSRDQ